METRSPFRRLLGAIPLVLLLSTTLCVRAENDGEKKPAYAFRAVGWNRDIPGVHYDSGGKDQTLDLHRGTISAEQQLDGDGRLVLRTEATTADGETALLPLVTVKLRPLPEKNLVVVWLGKSGNYQAMALPDDSASLTPGQARFVNITGYRLALNCNDSTQVIEAGGRLVVSATRGGLGIKVAVQRETNGGWKLAAMSAVRVRPSTRVTVFLADSSELAPAPEDETRQLVAEPLSLFVITDRVSQKSS